MEAVSMPAQEALVVKTAQTATYAGGATSVVFGLTPGEWQALGVIIGIIVGVAGLAVTWYYKARHLRIAEIKAGLDE